MVVELDKVTASESALLFMVGISIYFCAILTPKEKTVLKREEEPDK